MAQFLSEDALNAALIDLIREAQEMIVLISPYVKLHERIKTTLKAKLKDTPIRVIVVFGKNTEHLEKSLSRADFDFFKEFPDVEIRYNARLHAKYYASEKAAILTSMNLYDFSQNHNIEVGVLLKSSRLADLTKGVIGGGLDAEAYNYFMQNVVEQSDLVFNKEAIFKDSFLGLTSTYLSSEIKEDHSEKFFKGEVIINKKPTFKRWGKGNEPLTTKPNGYCIRTGVAIPFNTKHPFSSDAFKSWSRFSNPDYPEKFCHFSGEPANGETSAARPILRKNWQKAKEIHSF